MKELSNTTNQLNQLLNYDNEQNDSLVDLISAFQLSPIINSLPYLPYTKSSLRYSSITYFLNDIIINRRKVIVEFGSGISTIILANLIDQLNLTDLIVLSIDNNQDWLNIISSYFPANNNIRLIYADNISYDEALENNIWYNTNKLDIIENYKGKVDCVLIDGPEAWHKEIELSRYPALPFIHSYLSDNCSVFLDDTNRNGEQKILEMWNSKFEFKIENLNSNFTRLFRGASFNIS